MASSFRSLPPLPTNLPSTGFATSHDVDYKQIVQSVKLLYLRRQYKQCANLCEKHLTDLGSQVIHSHLNSQTLVLKFHSSIHSTMCSSTSLPGLHMTPKPEACQVGLRYYLELSMMQNNFFPEHNKLCLLLFREMNLRSSILSLNKRRRMLRVMSTTTHLAIP
jgi:hypothetical protein